MFPTWFGYDPADLLIYAPRAYAALIDAYNRAIWPMHVLAVLAMAAMALLRWQQTQGGFRVCMILLAAYWAWVSMSFFGRHYSVLHWAAGHMALLFAIQALWLLVMAALPPHGATPWRSGLPGMAGAAIFLSALIVPLARTVYQDRAWTQLALPGLMPDPTAVATLGALLMVRGKLALPAAAIPLAWCIYSGALHWAMHGY